MSCPVLTTVLQESDEGSAELETRARRAQDIVARSLKGLANSIRIEGHTDSRPIHTARFASNWELSTCRAATFIRFVIDYHQRSLSRISALGYGEFRPPAPNDRPENMAKNRPVDIVMLAANPGTSEPTIHPNSFSETTAVDIFKPLEETGH
jgi:chemotaxis protein MotB